MISTDVLRQVRRVQIRARRAVQSLVGGEYHSAFKGAGINFEDVREYQPGDDVRSIDWNVTARTGRPFLKRYVEERELTVLLAVDLSGSLRFGSTGQSKRAIAADLAALIAFAAITNGDRVGLFAFTDRIERCITPRRGSRQALRIIRDILFLEPQSPRTDLRYAMEELERIQRRRAVVFLISDFQGENYEQSFRRAARRHDLMAVHISDPLEHNWPDAGLVHVQDIETGTAMLIDSAAVGQSYAERAHSEKMRMQSMARAAKVDLVQVTTSGGHLEALVDLLRLRERRRRR